MAEGLSASEVGKMIAEHADHARAHSAHHRRDRTLSIVEAVLLSTVALLSAWSGYAATEWSTESSLLLAEAGETRSKANRAHGEAVELRSFDADCFNTWFIAYTAGNEITMRVAKKRLRPEFQVAFDAWLATKPAANPDAPQGPTFMKEYVQPEIEQARLLDGQAEELYAEGSRAGYLCDEYVRVTVFLASVLFLVGISTQFPIRIGRYSLIAVALALLAFSLAQLAQLPHPPN